MDSVELSVRLTARLSALVFASALFLFAAAGPRRRAIVAFAAFIAVHSVHFATVVLLAALTSGANVRDRGGWALVSTVAVVFYAAVLTTIRAWQRAASGVALTMTQRALAHASVAAIWLIFMNSYVGRIPRDARFAIPAAVLTSAALLYFRRGLAASSAQPARVP